MSTALTGWFERAHEYMPRVEYFEILPEPIALSEWFAISGGGFHEGERVELSIEFSDESVLPLGEVPLEHGAFRWEGGIPEPAPMGPAKVSMQVLDSTEVVWGVTRSTDVAAPTARSVTTPPADEEYSAADLAAWYERLSDVIWDVPGIGWTNLSEKKNRIETGLQPRRGTRDKVDTVLMELGIPREAVMIEVGCERVRQWPHEVGEPPDEGFLRTFDYSLEIASQAAYGETVSMKLILQNVSDEPISFVLGGRPAYDFVVTTPDGQEVWFWMCGKITLSVLDGESLNPRHKLEFTGEWEQVDNWGEPVPPGTYQVRGVLNFGPRNVLPVGVVVTAAQKVEVLK